MEHQPQSVPDWAPSPEQRARWDLERKAEVARYEQRSLEVDRLIEQARAPGVTNRFIGNELVSFNDMLSADGMVDLQRRLLVACTRSSKGDGLVTARHRYLLARLALQQGDAAEAERWLDELYWIVGGPVDLTSPWSRVHLEERHHLKLARSLLALQLGLVDRAREYRADAIVALEAYAAHPKNAGKVKSGKLVTHHLFLVDFELARMNPARALAECEKALESIDWTADFATAKDPADLEKWEATVASNQFEFERRKAAAVGQMALDDRTLRGEACRLLMEVFDRPVASARARLDAMFRTARLLDPGSDPDAIEQLSSRVEALHPSSIHRALVASIRLRLAATSSAQGDSEWDAAMGELVEDWLSLPPRPGGTGRLHFDDVGFIVNEGVKAALRSGDSTRALSRLLRAFEANDLARRMGVAPVAADVLIHETLRSGEAMIFLCPTGGTGLGLLVKDGSVTHFDIGSSGRVRLAARSFRRCVESPPPPDASERARLDEDLRRLSAEVRGLLLPEAVLEQVLASRRLMVVAPDLAFDVPLAALRVGDQSLGSLVPLSSLPAPQILHALRSREKPAGRGGLVVANVPDGRWTDPLSAGLSAPRVEPERALAWLGSGPAEGSLLQGPDGDVEAQLGGAGKGLRLGIYVAHGDTAVELERSSCVLLGGAGGLLGNGRLCAGDIEAMAVPDIVLLAICGAGLGPRRVGSGGSSHLGGAFLFSGAQAALLSASDIPVEGTKAMLDEVTRWLGQGVSLDVAVQRARAALESSERFGHAFHFGLLEVLGDGSACL